MISNAADYITVNKNVIIAVVVSSELTKLEDCVMQHVNIIPNFMNSKQIDGESEDDQSVVVSYVESMNNEQHYVPVDDEIDLNLVKQINFNESVVDVELVFIKRMKQVAVL